MSCFPPLFEMMQNWSSFHQAGCSCLLTNQRPPWENSNCGEKHILHWLTKYHKIWVGRCMLCRFSIHILRIYKHHTLFYDHWFPLDKPSKPEFRSRHMWTILHFYPNLTLTYVLSSHRKGTSQVTNDFAICSWRTQTRWFALYINELWQPA